MGAKGVKCDIIHDEEWVGIHDEKGSVDKRIDLANAYFFKGRRSLDKGDKGDALRMFRSSAALQEQIYGTYHKRTARSYFFLAQTLFKHSNDFDRALTGYRRSLRVGLSLGGDCKYVQGAKQAIRQILFNKKNFNVKSVENFFSSVAESVRLENEGMDYTSNKNYEYALEAFENCLSIEKKAEGTFPLDLGHIYIRIAEVKKKQGGHGKVINAYRSALSIYNDALGEDHPDSIRCLQGIESAMHEMSFSTLVIEDYIKLILKSLNHCRKGDTLMESKMFHEAVNEYEAASAIEERYLGRYPLTSSDIRKKLGMAFRSLKDYDRAILELRTTLSINLFEYGEDHQSLVFILQEIRSVMGEKGYDFSSVNKYMNTIAFSVKHERYGEHLLVDKKDFSGAIEEFQKSLILEVSALGKYHLTQGGLFKAIGDAFIQNRIVNFAVVNYRNSLRVYLPILGIEHRYTLATLTQIGNAALGIGLKTDEVDAYRQTVTESIAAEKTVENLTKDHKEFDAIAIYRKVARREGSLIGDHHLSIADIHGKIASILKKMKRYDSSIASYRYILAINLKSLGINHMNTEKVHEELLDVAIMKGLRKEDAVKYGYTVMLSIEHEDKGDEAIITHDFQSAIYNYKKALELEENVLGTDHLVIEGILRKLLACYKSCGESDQALHFYRKLIRIYMMYVSPDYDVNYMLCSLETIVQVLGLHEADQAEYIAIVTESMNNEINENSEEQSQNYVEAIDLYSRYLLMEQSLLGALHPSIYIVNEMIGSTLGGKGELNLSFVSYSKVLSILERYLGMKEKQMAEIDNDILHTAQKKLNCMYDVWQVDSRQKGEIKALSELSFEEILDKRKKHQDNAQQKEGKKGINYVYSVFDLLRKSVTGKTYNSKGDKMKILTGLTQRWNELDESGTLFEIDTRERRKENQLASNILNLFSRSQNEDSKRVSDSWQQSNKLDVPSKSLDLMCESLKSSKHSKGKNRLELDTHSNSLPENHAACDINEIGDLIYRFNNKRNVNRIESEEGLQRIPATPKGTNKSDRLAKTLVTSGKEDEHTMNKSTNSFEKCAFRIDIPEIPSFNSNYNTKCDEHKGSDDATISSDSKSSISASSISSYESI